MAGNHYLFAALLFVGCFSQAALAGLRNQASGSSGNLVMTTDDDDVDLPTGTVILLKGGRWNNWCRDEGNRVICNGKTTRDPWAKFTVTKFGNGKIGLKGGRNGKWCTDEGDNIACNKNWARSWEKFTVENKGGPQDGKIVLKGGRNEKYCSDEGNRVVCNRPTTRAWETFTVEKLDQGQTE